MSRLPFSSKQRLKVAAEFDAVLKAGKRLSLSCFVLCFTPSDQAGCRIGLMISKRHCPLAVRRNRIKRLVREYVRLHQKTLPSVDIVFLSRSKTASLTDEEQVSCIKSLFDALIKACSGSASE